MFKTETHLHTLEVSICGKVRANKMVELYHDAGYQTICVSDHVKQSYFDYILMHKYEQIPPRGTVSKDLQELTSFIEGNVQYKHWYSGHWHKFQQVDEKHTLVYDALVSVD